MTLDILTRLSGTTGTSAAGQSIATATAAAPVYSTNYFDLDAGGSLRTKRTMQGLFGEFWFTTTPDSATNTATLDIELVMCPTAVPGTPTLAAFNATDDVDDTTDVITSTAHGLIDGTRITVAVTSGLILGGLAVSTNYYLRDVTTNTFKVAATPGGTAINLTDAVGTNTVTWYPEVVGASSKLPLERLILNKTRVYVPVAPTLIGSPMYPVHRYLFARYVPTANLSAGVAFGDLVRGTPMSNFPVNPSNYTTP
jgi:hypothetical protein